MNQNLVLAALGPLAPLYEDPDVHEIMVDAHDKVIVDRKDELVDAGIKFETSEALRDVIDAVLSLGGVTLSSEQTSGHIRLPDASRVMAVIPPTAVNGPCLVIRKVRLGRLYMEDLLKFGSVTQEEYSVLQSAIQSRLNILIAGGTGSGKTTFANILTDEFPDSERIIVVESIYELQPRVERFVRLAADNSPDHSFADLINLASKMRPDRLLIGELQGAEALQAINIFNMGHDGSMTTIHAVNPEDALSRLESMCLMANLGLGLSEIRNMIATAIQLITYQEHLPDGSRKLTHVVELLGLKNGRYVLQPLFRYNPETKKIEATGSLPSWI